MTERQIARELPPPTKPLTVARELARQYGKTLAWWNQGLYQYSGRHWEPWDAQKVVQFIALTTEAGTYKTADGIKPWDPSTRKVNDVWGMWRGALLFRDDEISRVHALNNGIVRVVGKARARELTEHSPAVFNLAYRPFDYDPAATAPLWEKFIGQALPSQDDRDLLQEWCGYSLGGGTEHQKIMSLWGKRRAGKGTVLRIVEALVGEENVAAGSLSQLTSTHGLEPLIGKSMLTFGDVRWNNTNAADAVKLLLEISGEDRVSVNPKGKTILNLRLAVRVMFAGNHLPRVNDPSGAFAARLLSLYFGESFEGREDPYLEGKLREELPGIFNWALDGADRLAERGRFTESASSVAAKESIQDAGSGIQDFLDDYLYTADGAKVTEDEVMEYFAKWCERVGRRHDSTSIHSLRPQILEAFPGVENKKSSRREPGSRTPVSIRVFKGLGALPPSNPLTPFDD